MPYSIAGRKAQQLLTNVRLKLYAFFLSLRVTTTTTTTAAAAAAAAVVNDTTTTAFRMQHDGEIDVRATYCILAPCYLLQLIDINNESSSSSSSNNNNNDTFTTNAATPPTTNNPLQCILITGSVLPTILILTSPNMLRLRDCSCLVIVVVVIFVAPSPPITSPLPTSSQLLLITLPSTNDVRGC